MKDETKIRKMDSSYLVSIKRLKLAHGLTLLGTQANC